MENKNIVKIISLHKIEKKLFDINNERGDLPIRISKIKDKINVLTVDNDKYNERLLEINKEKVMLNGNLSDIEEKISTLNEQMYKVKSNKEYEALLSEIDHLNNENSNSVKQLESFDAEVREGTDLINSNTEELETSNGNLLKIEDLLKTTNLEIEEEESSLTKDKDFILKNLANNKSLIDLYNDKKNEYEGLAFSEINQSCCNHCYSSLPPQLIIDATNQNQLVECPSCSILLYIEDIDDED